MHESKPVLLISTFLTLCFASILAMLLLQNNRLFGFGSSARELKSAHCPLNATIYVHELNENGLEVPLSADTHPDLDILEWSISDGQNTQAQPLYFNALPEMTYSQNAQVLAFSALPVGADIYNRGDVTFLKLNYPASTYKILKKEIATCSSPHRTDLCAQDITTTTDLDTITGISLECDINIEAGWVVQKIMSVDAQAVAPPSTSCDLNKDGTCNTFDLIIVIDDYGKQAPGLPGDLNTDGTVNALDYTLLVGGILQ